MDSLGPIVKKKLKRIPKNYDGNLPTARHLKNLLHTVVEGFSFGENEKKQLVYSTFQELIGPKISSMAKASDFVDGVLFVTVKNSSLYSILRNQQKEILIKKIREKLPNIEIKNIAFRIGT